MHSNYTESVLKQFKYYKVLGENAMAQIPDDKLAWQINEESNSISTLVKHMSGNMLSRWTDFLTTDGEKPWRNRDAEFENDITSREGLLNVWNEGWRICLASLQSLKVDDLEKIIYIRNEGHTVVEAINRQLAHYSYHVGQIVFIGKIVAPAWKSLSIPREKSKNFNELKFMEHTIIPATPKDLPLIYNLFEEAIRFQKDNQYIGWNNYDSEFIRTDVDQGLLLKIVNEHADVMAIFCICYTDKLIWRNREQGDALYLHRIVLNRVFQGMKIFNIVLKWSIDHASTHKRTFVRMDTWAENHKLINYYKGYGFKLIENYTTHDTPELPIQHRNLHVALLELAV